MNIFESSPKGIIIKYIYLSNDITIVVVSLVTSLESTSKIDMGIETHECDILMKHEFHLQTS